MVEAEANTYKIPSQLVSVTPSSGCTFSARQQEICLTEDNWQAEGRRGYSKVEEIHAHPVSPDLV